MDGWIACGTGRPAPPDTTTTEPRNRNASGVPNDLIPPVPKPVRRTPTRTHPFFKLFVATGTSPSGALVMPIVGEGGSGRHHHDGERAHRFGDRPAWEAAANLRRRGKAGPEPSPGSITHRYQVGGKPSLDTRGSSGGRLSQTGRVAGHARRPTVRAFVRVQGRSNDNLPDP